MNDIILSKYTFFFRIIRTINYFYTRREKRKNIPPVTASPIMNQFYARKRKLNHLQIAKSLVSNMKSIATVISRRKKSSGIGSEISHLIKKMLRKILSNRLKLRPPRQKSGLGRETVRI